MEESLRGRHECYFVCLEALPSQEDAVRRVHHPVSPLLASSKNSWREEGNDNKEGKATPTGAGGSYTRDGMTSSTLSEVAKNV